MSGINKPYTYICTLSERHFRLHAYTTYLTLYRLYVGSLEQFTAYFVKGSFEAFGPFVWYERECSGCVLSVRSIEANRQLGLEVSNDRLTYGEQ